MTVRTRFAPSPTGYLHIGGVRTALFNWLFARKHGGRFILRIDDTDQGRNQPEALQPILDGFKWLGLNWDEGPEVGGDFGPYFQSEKLPRYQQAVQQLLDKGLAYWDYATPEEMKAEREAAEKEKRPYLYSRTWIAETPEKRGAFEAEGRAGSVRLKMPRGGTCRFFDHIRGEMAFEWATEQDTVIQRSDGTVTYNLANVVDDFDMKITHVIRAEEHLSNTPRQIFMLEGLGYPRPAYAHVPFVSEPGSKNKLSKRKIAQYLKNPDFKRVYEHGQAVIEKRAWKHVLDIASDIRQMAYEARQSGGTSQQEVQATLDKVFEHYSQSRAIGEDDPTQVSLLLVKDTITELLQYPGYLETYEYGQRLFKQLGPNLPPEAFNPVLVDFYKQVGYLPDAIVNYLLLLGWSYDDKTEVFTRDEMIREFSLERVNKAPASLDVKKLGAFQELYSQRVGWVLPYLQRAKLVPSPTPSDLVRKAIQVVTAAADRIKVAGDVLDYDYFFLPDDHVAYDEKAVEKFLSKPPGPDWVRKLRTLMEGAEPPKKPTIDPFDAPVLRKRIEEFAHAEGVKPGDVSQALRVAVTGKGVGFDAYATLAILGRDRCLARIDRALAKL